MRDRLIEKISILEEMVVDPKANFKITDVQRILRQAREMLEKAIVPPCKVGDKVWDSDFGRACSYIVTGFDIGKTLDDEEKHKELFMYYENSNGSVQCNCPVSQMGKTVFLTKEEAEQALGKLQASYKQVKGGEG